jgi:hypothetical protein
MKTTSKMTQALFLGVIFLFISAFVGNVFVSDAKAQSCIQPPEGMVSWWPGDGNADDIVGGNDGTLLNGTTFALGKVGEALSFDGVDDFVWATGTGIDDLQELTIDAWVKLNSMDRDEERFVTLTGEKAVLRHDGLNSLGQLHFYMRFDDDLHHIRVNDVLGVGVWYHVAGTYDSEVMRLYLNGVEVDNLLVTGMVYTGSGVELSADSEPINGLLDEVEIFSRVLSADEIWAIFNADSAGKCKMTTVSIDIKPGSYPNSINPNAGGVIPVAILTTDIFDASTVNPETVVLEGAGARDKGKSGRYGSMEDVDGDGDLDLVVQVENEIDWAENATEATLTGETYDGIPIEGTDSVNIVPPE